MSLQLDQLERIRQRGDKIVARCPACAEDNRDRSGEHLVIFPDGRFACSSHSGDHEHRQRIFALVGTKDTLAPRSARLIQPRAVACDALPRPIDLPPDFGLISMSARGLLYDSVEAQTIVANELGLSTATVKACTMPAGGALGFFPSISIKGTSCHPNRIGYVYPSGIKLRNPWGNLGIRFAWAYGRATEPWRYTFAAWRPCITRFIITEGESDALALFEAGLGKLCDGDTAVVASPGTSFPPEWARLFSGRHTVICFDCDEAGQRAAHKVAASVYPFALSVNIQTGWRTGNE